jgi:hypothetical protein
MEVLEIVFNIGKSATPIQIEAAVKAVRVASDAGRDTVLRKVRRTAREQLKFPTGGELIELIERRPQGPYLLSEDVKYRISYLLDTGRHLRQQSDETIDRWNSFSSFARNDESIQPPPRGRHSNGEPGLQSSHPLIGMDILEPELYDVLVADRVSRLAPIEITVRGVRYQNPFGEELAAVGSGIEALTKTAGVIETAATLGARIKIKKAEATVAEATIDDRIVGSQLDCEL